MANYGFWVFFVVVVVVADFLFCFGFFCSFGLPLLYLRITMMSTLILLCV